MGTINRSKSGTISDRLNALARSDKDIYRDLAIPVAGIAIAALALSLYILQSRAFYFHGDLSCYLGYAQDMLRGKVIYSQIVTDKPPLAILAHIASAIVAPRSYVALYVTQWVVILMQIGIFVRFLKPSLGIKVVVGVSLLFLPLTHLDYNWLSTEHVSNLWIAALLVLAVLIRRSGVVTPAQCFMCGMLTALAWQTRPNALLGGIVPIIVILSLSSEARVAVRYLLRIVAGGIAGFSLVLVYVWFVGSVSNFIHITFVHPFVYVGTSGPGGRIGLLRALISNGQTLLSVSGLALAIALLGPNRRFAIFVAAAGVITCNVSPRPFDHYWMNLLPFIATLFIIGLDSLPAHAQPVSDGRDDPNPNPAPALRIPTLVLILSVVTTLAPRVLAVSIYALNQPKHSQMDEVVDQLNSTTTPGTTLAVLGPTASEFITATSHLVPANPIWSIWLLGENEMLSSLYAPSDTVVREYIASPPEVVVVDKPWIQTIYAAVKEDPQHRSRPILELARWVVDCGDYVHVQSIGRFVIYRHRKSSQPSASDVAPTITGD